MKRECPMAYPGSGPWGWEERRAAASHGLLDVGIRALVVLCSHGHQGRDGRPLVSGEHFTPSCRNGRSLRLLHSSGSQRACRQTLEGCRGHGCKASRRCAVERAAVVHTQFVANVAAKSSQCVQLPKGGKITKEHGAASGRTERSRAAALREQIISSSSPLQNKTSAALLASPLVHSTW